MAEETPLVDGATRLYGIIGHPIAQVGSPRLFTARFRAAGLNALLLPLHVLPDHFDETLRGIMALANLDGLVVTIPYKPRVVSFVDRALPSAHLIGAINAMRRERDGSWTGDNFDGKGLIRALIGRGHSVAGRRAMLIGAGGAGKAIGFALAEAGAAAVGLFDVDADKAENLHRRISAAFPRCSAEVTPPRADGYDILINATPIGMVDGDGLPAVFPAFDPALLVVDIIIKPELTPLLAHAQACGCQIVGGRAMLEGQADEIMRFFGLLE